MFHIHTYVHGNVFYASDFKLYIIIYTQTTVVATKRCQTFSPSKGRVKFEETRAYRAGVGFGAKRFQKCARALPTFMTANCSVFVGVNKL